MNPSPTPLKFLGAPWFAVVMGLSGLSLAWLRAVPLMGEMAGAAAMALAGVAVVAFGVLLVAYGWRSQRYPQATAEDFRHPVRYPFIATIPMSILLMATLGTIFTGPSQWLRALWVLGATLQFVVTLWSLQRWLQPGQGLAWPGMTPVLMIPVVGNVLVPMAGVPLGFEAWSAAQFGVGLLFWPIVLVLLMVRLGVSGMWPERMLPSTFITVVAPCLIGSAAVQWQAPWPLVWMLWGTGLFFLLWSGTVVRRCLAQPFSMAFWSVSFPMAAFSALTLRLADTVGGAFQSLSLMLLALTTLVIAGLCLATIKGLRAGTLLAPEPVAIISAANQGPP